MTGTAPIRIGISACILGQEVRYDGGHKLDRFVRDTFGAFVEYVPVCPEVEVGMGIPRETLRLVQSESGPRMVTRKSGVDHTDSMRAWSRGRLRDLAALDLCGYILQKGSPSCGMERVKVYPEAGGTPTKSGRGVFAEALMEALPNLPVEEDGRLNDPRLRENFVERVFAYRRLKDLFAGRWTVGALVGFHAREKMLLLAHDRVAYTELGRLVAGAKALPRAEVAATYERVFMAGMTRIATTRKHTNVLQHLAGHFKRLLEDEDRDELHGSIELYHRGLVPLVVPITLLRHHVRRHRLDYLAQQSYLDPHPTELMLRNHV